VMHRRPGWSVALILILTLFAGATSAWAQFNAAPYAAPDSAEVQAGQSVTIAVLANDSDPEGDPLSITAVGSPAHGAAVLNTDGTITYTPAAGWPAPGDPNSDSFTYTITDGQFNYAIGTVTITVLVGLDADGDGVPDATDNCVGVPNPDQADNDLDGQGDVCGADDDNDGNPDAIDACPFVANTHYATTSADGHTMRYCTIEAAAFASDGPGQTVLVSAGSWPGEAWSRNYGDSPNLTVTSAGSRANTILNGLSLTGATFNGLAFDDLTFRGDAAGYGNFTVSIDGPGSYAHLAFLNAIFDGENAPDRGAIFANQGWQGFVLSGNTFVNFANSEPADLGGGYVSNYSLVFMEAQNGTGNGFSATGNLFQDVRHINALEAFRWANVTISGNAVTGARGRLLVWSYADTPLNAVTIRGNTITVSGWNAAYPATGIGVYYVDGTVNIAGNAVSGASTCLNVNGVADLTVTDNTLNACGARAMLFGDTEIAPVAASITGNTFSDSPVGVENRAATFELNTCANTFVNVANRQFSNPGPFASCGADLSVTKTGPAEALYDAEIAYTITVTNNGPQAATAVTLTDTLPQGVLFMSVSNPACTHAAGVITCALGDLADQSRVTIRVMVRAGIEGVVVNTAAVTSQIAELDPADNTASTETTIVKPCNPMHDMAGYLSVSADGRTATGRIYNASTHCTYDVGMASYRRFDNVIDHQEIFSWATDVIGPDEWVVFTLDLPDCAAQVDLFYGPVLMSMDGQRYGDRLLAARLVGENFCPLCLDSDLDGVCDEDDNCPQTPNPDQADADQDGRGDVCDNCPQTPNPDQADTDRDGVGDVCDTTCPDADTDGICDDVDNCWLVFNPNQADADQDGVGNLCDNCIDVPNTDQADADSDGVGDVCEMVCSDVDQDGVCDEDDNCPQTPNPDQADADSDGRGDVCDNCPQTPNPDQADADSDGVGDVCDTTCPDADADGICDDVDTCPLPNIGDSDYDGIDDACDDVIYVEWCKWYMDRWYYEGYLTPQQIADIRNAGYPLVPTHTGSCPAEPPSGQ